MKIFVALALLALSFVGCATTQTTISERSTITEKYPYAQPTYEQSVGVEWKW